MNSPAIATQFLTRSYGKHLALNAVSLAVEPGSVYALVGPNGAGKSTLIQLLMNLQRPTSGSATIFGAPCNHLRGDALQRIGYISESQELPDYLTVQGFLDFLRPFYPTWDRALESQLVADFALPLDRKLRHLSRGMRMKAAFAGTLACRPALLILDEPFSGLDPLTRDELIQGLLDRIGETTLFLSSHDLAEIESFASHVGYLEQGVLLFSEEMIALSARFRAVEFTAASAEFTAAGASSPTRLPETWLQLAHSGSLVRFTHSAFSTGDEAAAEVRALFPNATDISFEPLSLREIFLATARSHRVLRNGQTSRSITPLPAGVNA